MIQSPCKECERRCVGCHSTCKEYLDFRQAVDKESALIQYERRLRYQQYSDTRNFKRRGQR